MAGVRSAGRSGRVEARRKGRDVAGRINPLSGIDAIGFRADCCGRVFRRRDTP